MYMTFKIRHMTALSELTRECIFSPFLPVHLMSAAASVPSVGSLTLHSQTVPLPIPTPSPATVTPSAGKQKPKSEVYLMTVSSHQDSPFLSWTLGRCERSLNCFQPHLLLSFPLLLPECRCWTSARQTPGPCP